MTAPAPAVTLVPAPLPEPLRLPRGSVRGLLALGLMATFGYLLLETATAPPAVLVNAVVVALAFYFGSHGGTGGSVAAQPGMASGLHRPWVVRSLLLLGFGGLAGWLYWSGARLPGEMVQVLEILGGYVAGAVLSWFFHRRVRESPIRRRVALMFRDLSAAAALGLTAFACYSFATGIAGVFSSDVEQALSLVITYYFGSRVIAR